jgi:hypothetical protein
VITASRNSSKLSLAMESARKKSVSTVGITVFDRGVSRHLTNLSVYATSRNWDYAVAEEVHLPACHMVDESLSRRSELTNWGSE